MLQCSEKTERYIGGRQRIMVWTILIIILAILLAALIALIYFGNKMQ